MDLASTALRCLLAYVFLLVLVRLSGKRLIRQASAMDLVTSLLLGELVDKLLTGKVPFAEYATASIAIICIHRLVEFSVYHSPVLAGWLSGREQALLKQAKLERGGMRSERVSERTILAALRARATRDLRAIKAADLEVNGEISALKEDWAREAQHQDARKLPRPGGEQP